MLLLLESGGRGTSPGNALRRRAKQRRHADVRVLLFRISVVSPSLLLSSFLTLADFSCFYTSPALFDVFTHSTELFGTHYPHPQHSERSAGTHAIGLTTPSIGGADVVQHVGARLVQGHAASKTWKPIRTTWTVMRSPPLSISTRFVISSSMMLACFRWMRTRCLHPTVCLICHPRRLHQIRGTWMHLS